MDKHLITIIHGYPAKCCRSHSTNMIRCSCGFEEEARNHDDVNRVVRGHKLEAVIQALGLEVKVKSETMSITEVVTLRKEMNQI